MTDGRRQSTAARVVLWLALAVAAVATVLWYFGILRLLAPILAGASAVVAITAGVLLGKTRAGS